MYLVHVPIMLIDLILVDLRIEEVTNRNPRDTQTLTIFYNGTVSSCDVTEIQVGKYNCFLRCFVALYYVRANILTICMFMWRRLDPSYQWQVKNWWERIMKQPHQLCQRHHRSLVGSPKWFISKIQVFPWKDLCSSFFKRGGLGSRLHHLIVLNRYIYASLHAELILIRALVSERISFLTQI